MIRKGFFPGEKIMTVYSDILTELRFGFIGTYRVAGMGEPWAAKIEITQKILKEEGIGGILTLTEDDLYGKNHKEGGFFHHHEPIDDCEPPDVEGMDRAIDFMNKCLDNGVGVAVHCFEGRGRTGTVLGAWLGIKESLGPEETIKRINELRYHTVLTPSQRDFLHQYLAPG
jgi:atypical dual specificity phosphatase